MAARWNQAPYAFDDLTVPRSVCRNVSAPRSQCSSADPARNAFEIINENFEAVVAGIPDVSESGVQSVNGQIPDELGVVTLTAADVGAEPAGSGSDVFSNLNTLT